jgi:hypothetical protein
MGWPVVARTLHSARAPRSLLTCRTRSGQMRSSPTWLEQRGRIQLAGRCWSGGAPRRVRTVACGPTGFPLILLVTTGPGPEQRLARALRAVEVGQRTPLPALLATTALLQTTSDGPLGCVWRTAANPARRKAWG